jgi:hypothetical protein
MLSRPDWEFTIVCPFGGQPSEEPHRSKYLILHDEHQRVCEFAGWDLINGPFLDDAAAGSEPWDEALLSYWLSETLVEFGQMWWPMGVHHPDHEIVSRFRFSRVGVQMLTYEELPYRVLYPDRVNGTLGHLQGYDPSNLNKKRELCRMYASQVDDQLERCLYAPERLWVAR